MTVRISNMTSTFANLEIAYNAISMDVTDTASDANSTLLNLKVANTSKFSVRKDGTFFTTTDANIGNNLIAVNVQTNTANVQTLTVNVATITTVNVQAITTNTFVSETATVNSIFTMTTALTPANSTAIGIQGQIAWDVNYIYVCVANNTWKRTAMSTWV